MAGNRFFGGKSRRGRIGKSEERESGTDGVDDGGEWVQRS